VREPILEALQALDIPYQLFQHPPVHTAEEAAVHWQSVPWRGGQEPVPP
jgi:hypothetical protein